MGSYFCASPNPRVLTAAFLGPLFLFGVLKLSEHYFAALIGLVVLAGSWEWTALSGYDDRRLKMSAVVVVFLTMIAGFQYRDSVSEPAFILTCAIWLVVAGSLFHRRRRFPLSWPNPVRWLCGVWTLVPAWLAIFVLQYDEPMAAVMLFLLIWAADTGAYFAGRRWGRRKLAPAISPGKTLEGVAGALAAAAIVAGAFGALWGLNTRHGSGLILFSVAVALMSVFGDLFESNWKRLANVKDSGGLLPGHGGVLDRIDSMTAGAPFFTLGWLWWFSSAAA